MSIVNVWRRDLSHFTSTVHLTMAENPRGLIYAYIQGAYAVCAGRML